MEFYEKLIRLRKSRHMTQTDLANVLGISRQAVYKWECGQSYPEAMKLVALKQLFGISIDNLLDPDYSVEVPLRAHKSKITQPSDQMGVITEKPLPTDGTIATDTNKEPVNEVSEEATVGDSTVQEGVTYVHDTPEGEENTDIADAENQQTQENEPVLTKTPNENPQNTEENTTPEKKKSFFARLFGRK